jgi:PleD family two-component response regulator
LAAIRAKNHALDVGPSFQVTASMGVAVHVGESHRFKSVEDFLEAANQTLYKAKAQGRDCLITHY